MKKCLIILLALLSMHEFTNAQDWRRLQSLKGRWLFSIGDDQAWASPNYNDRDWESIKVPSSWENEGFHGYDGYAWYRKHFSVDNDYAGKTIYFRLGRVDDVDEVYLNGRLIGATGTFPPNYESAYYAWREYNIPSNYFNYKGDNVIAIRVFDGELEGGIIEGDVGLYIDMSAIKLSFNLGGFWKFNTGDDMQWKNPGFSDKDWKNIYVPGYWEKQGYANYDGFAWYRKKFTPPAGLSADKLVLYLSKIDDIDEVYINGKLVGSTGNLNRKPIKYDTYGEYAQIRGYYIPDGLIKFNQENVIAVRVYDGYKDGGIYGGPVGLVKQSDYSAYIRQNRSEDKKSFWDWIFE